jgi:hypothetical protein
MADLDCLVELEIANLIGIVEEVTIDCSVGVAIAGELSLGLTAGKVLDLQVGIEIGGELLVSPPSATVSLDEGLDVGYGFSLASGPSIAKPVISSVALEVGGSLSLTKVVPSVAVAVSTLDLTPVLEVGVTMGPVVPLIVPVTVGLTPIVKVEGSFGLISQIPDTSAFTLLSKPVALEVGADLGLEAFTFPAAKVISGVVTMQVGGSMGLVANLPPVTVVLLNGGTSIGGSFLESADIAEIFETWVLTGNKFGASVYSGFDFNSYARHRGQEYAAGPDGIYLLGGPDDDGQEIHPGVRLVTNFASEKHKRLRSIHLGKCGEEVQIRVAGDSGEGFFEPDTDGHRAVISRNLESQQFTLDIVDFEQLSHLEVSVLPLNKR